MTATPTAPTGILLPTIEPGSPEWLRRMSASKVAAVLGLSPWESRFSLWHRMAGLVNPVETTDEMRRGHYLEPACCAWFADQHPDWKITETGTFVHPDDDRWAATPDRLVTTDTGEVRLLQAKTDAGDEEWGEPGTDEIPVYYRAQVQWEMFVTGARVCHLSFLTAYLEFREYIVPFDQADVDRLVPAADEFMCSLPGGSRPQRPNLDDHSATYQVVRELNPDCSGDLDIDQPLAERFCTAQHRVKEAKATEQAARTELADVMGSYKRALFLGKPIAVRQCKPGGLPYLVAGRNLPRFDDPTEKAA